jgi:hypothetical protein
MTMIIQFTNVTDATATFMKMRTYGLKANKSGFVLIAPQSKKNKRQYNDPLS